MHSPFASVVHFAALPLSEIRLTSALRTGCNVNWSETLASTVPCVGGRITWISVPFFATKALLLPVLPSLLAIATILRAGVFSQACTPSSPVCLAGKPMGFPFSSCKITNALETCRPLESTTFTVSVAEFSSPAFSSLSWSPDETRCLNTGRKPVLNAIAENDLVFST